MLSYKTHLLIPRLVLGIGKNLESSIQKEREREREISVTVKV